MTITNIDVAEGDSIFSIGDWFLLREEEGYPSILCQLAQVSSGQVVLLCVWNGSRVCDPVGVGNVLNVTWDDVFRCASRDYTIIPVKEVNITYKL